MTKILPKEITSYDLLKMTAVLLMIIDHVGFYFYPEENWFRAVGRLCVPMWFFLIGHARSRDVGLSLWIGGGILLAANVVVGYYILPLNILFTMLVVRLVLDRFIFVILKSSRDFWSLNAVVLILAVPSMVVIEYGTLAIIMALYGFFVRYQNDVEEEYKEKAASQLNQYFLFAFISFVFLQFLAFGFEGLQVQFLAIGTLIVMGGLYHFKSKSFPRLTSFLPLFFVKLIQIFGRRTLEIYVLHLLLFKFAALWWDPERFSLFDWEWMIPLTEDVETLG